MNEHDKDIYDSGIFCGTLDERQRIIKLLESLDPFGSIDTAFVPELIELIKGETNG